MREHNHSFAQIFRINISDGFEHWLKQGAFKATSLMGQSAPQKDGHTIRKQDFANAC